jgi:hypothetical protein
MAYNVNNLLTKSEAELTALFSNAEAGPIPNGDAQGTAIIAPGTTFTPEMAKIITSSPGKAKSSTQRRWHS